MQKQQDTFSHLYLHHHALCNDQCFSDRIFQKHPEWLPSGSGSSHPDPYFSSGICTDHRQATEIKCGRKESIIYSNSGNLVIPLVTVVLGEKWVIYASAFLSVQMILMWTHGQSLMEAKAGINWKKILCNINLIAIILGIVLFFTQIRLPVILGNTMSQISATLGPVCMIMLGMTMTEVKWKDIFSHSRIYLVTILKNGGDAAAHTVVFEVSALGFNGKGWKNHSAYQSDGSDHTVGNNDCTAGTALRSGPGLCQHHQCNDNAGKYHNHATDGHVVSCLSISGNRYG